VVWAAYGFRARISEDAGVEQAMRAERAEPGSNLARGIIERTERWGVLPEDYLRGLRFVLRHSEGRPTFLMGQLSNEGFSQYFLATFALKTPIPLVLLIIITFAVGRASWPSRIVVWLPVVLYLGLTFTRSINIGHRHLLPIYPFLFVAAGQAAGMAGRGRAGTVLLGLLCAWYAFGTLRIHPHYLAYFNEIAGGRATGTACSWTRTWTGART
jgi:hypothetical protein